MTYKGYQITASYKLWTFWDVDEYGEAVRHFDTESIRFHCDDVYYDVRKDGVPVDDCESLASFEDAKDAIDRLVTKIEAP
jgi:hypothetical protein